MKKLILVITISLFFSFRTFAIIIDPKTNEIGIAGASCTYNCYGIGKIIPKKGAIIVQRNRESAQLVPPEAGAKSPGRWQQL